MEKKILIAARTVSALFNPFYLPVVGLVVLFVFSYLSLLPWLYKLMVLVMVYVLTALLPTLFIRMYHRYEGWTVFDFFARERRMIPYVISLACYLLCYYLLRLLHVPSFMRSIVVSALAIQVTCAIVNNWWKISTHMAAVGGVAGALMAFGFIFSFNPVWWLGVDIVVSGIVGTSRMLLRQHSLGQICGGFGVGLAAALITVLST